TCDVPSNSTRRAGMNVRRCAMLLVLAVMIFMVFQACGGGSSSGTTTCELNFSPNIQNSTVCGQKATAAGCRSFTFCSEGSGAACGSVGDCFGHTCTVGCPSTTTH